MPSEVDLFLEDIKGTEIGQPATEQEITEFELRYAVNLPSDIREYFLKINGMYIGGIFIKIEALQDWSRAVDDQPMKDIAETLSLNPQKLFRFGNYDIDVWYWLIDLNTNATNTSPIYVTCQYSKAILLANTFSDFLQKYRVLGAEQLLGYN